jgi:hypothetical protein
MAVNRRNAPARIGGVIGAAIGGGFGGWVAVHYGNTILAGVGGGIGALFGWYVGWQLWLKSATASEVNTTRPLRWDRPHRRGLLAQLRYFYLPKLDTAHPINLPLDANGFDLPPIFGPVTMRAFGSVRGRDLPRKTRPFRC